MAWIVFSRTGSTRATWAILSLSSLVGIVAVHLSLGGYANSGAIMMWGIAMTTVGVLLLNQREALAIGVIVGSLAIVLGFFEQTLRAGRAAPEAALPALLASYNVVAVLVLAVPVIGLLVNRFQFERERAESLLLNVLPAEVATELKETGGTESRQFASVSVLFADIVGFTPMAATMEPGEMVDQLNEIFSHFDALAEKYGCEKIRTIGDAYMVAAGVPTPTDDHADAICQMALDMMDYAAPTQLTFRIGINSGPVVAGVVGTSKFQYDIWGDTVNTASRMESHGEPGRIQISEGTHRLVADRFVMVPRGLVSVKGKGDLETWWLEGRMGGNGQV